MDTQPSMWVGAGEVTFPHICDLVRSAHTTGSGIHQTTIVHNLRCSVFFSRLFKKEGVAQGPVEVNELVVSTRVRDGQKPEVGDQLVGVRLARTGARAYERLYVRYVEQFGDQFNYHLWCDEAGQT